MGGAAAKHATVAWPCLLSDLSAAAGHLGA